MCVAKQILKYGIDSVNQHLHILQICIQVMQIAEKFGKKWLSSIGSKRKKLSI